MDIDIEICPKCELGYFKEVKDNLTGKIIYSCSYCGFVKKDN